MDPILGQIIMFAGDFVPKGWARCDGQLLPINQNQALFSLFGTMYGGDGRRTFALPDLRGRAPVHAGQGVGLPPVAVGEAGGVERVPLAGDDLAAPTAVRAPFLGVGFLIAVQGIYPARD